MTKCDGRTTKNAPCKRNAATTIPATAFTTELKFCKAHAAKFVGEFNGWMRAVAG